MASIVNPIRYAVVGLGWFGQAAVLPAFANAKENSRLVALVSGDPTKRQELSEQYGVPAYGYEDYERLLASGEVDAVYIVSPNSEHHQHTLAAARHQVHVLCEKPLADTAAACQEMIQECRDNGVLLMTAYRLHFEAANLDAVEVGQSGQLGELRFFESVNCQAIDEGNTRLDGDLGGSPLLDLGIYCLNAVRYLYRDEPVEVMAMSASRDDPRFREVPEMVTALLRFPGERLAMISCGFGESKTSTLRLIGTKGDLRLEPAFSHNAELRSYLTIDGKTREKVYPARDHIAPEIVYFSRCIIERRQPEPDGIEGLIDLRIMEAIQESYTRGHAVKVVPLDKPTRPGKEQHIRKSEPSKPDLVNAEPPA